MVFKLGVFGIEKCRYSSIENFIGKINKSIKYLNGESNAKCNEFHYELLTRLLYTNNTKKGLIRQINSPKRQNKVQS